MTSDSNISRPRLSKLIIKNFGCIGNAPVEIELDDIVVLVGPNNAGKSTILRAYQVAMSEGSNDAKLTIDDFPNRIIDTSNLPQIELYTVVYDNSPGARWIDNSTGEKVIKERWIWGNVNCPPVRYGYDVQKAEWAIKKNSDGTIAYKMEGVPNADGVPWGAANIANSRRPQPHLVKAFSQPEEQAEQVTRILLTALKERIKDLSTEEGDDDGSSKPTDYGRLLETLASLQRNIIQQTQEQIDKAEEELTNFISDIFRGYKVEFDAEPEEDLSNAVSFFKAGAQLKMGLESDFMSTVDRQGSGAQRTLMWAALRYVSEYQSQSTQSRPHILLLNEPELCLHPNAIRDACRILYNLPTSGNWQVMVATHSPAFVDLSRNNTTIIRVERTLNGQVSGTTVFRPQRAQLSPAEVEELKLLNLCDPYFTEFFFGGKTILVEGDTEYTAFNHVRSLNHEDFSDLHIVRARGKVTIALLAKIINQFGGDFAVLHDSDTPTTQSKSKGEIITITNPAWTNNVKILDEIKKSVGNTRLVSAITNWEMALFGEQAKGCKPYESVKKIKNDPKVTTAVKELLLALMEFDRPLPDNFKDWSNIEVLHQIVNSFIATHSIDTVCTESVAA